MVCVMEIESYPDLQESGCVQARDGGEEGQESHHSHYLSQARSTREQRGIFFFYCRSDTHGLFLQSPFPGTSGLGQTSKKRVQIGPFRLNETTGRLFVEVLFVPPEDQSAYRSSGGAKM